VALKASKLSEHAFKANAAVLGPENICMNACWIFSPESSYLGGDARRQKPFWHARLGDGAQ
jgi:hypothetical protein